MAYTRMPVADALISGNWAMLGSTLQHLILPAVVVAAYPAGVVARMTRAQVLDTVGETHVAMVRALGFGERAVFGRFAMKLAWNPVAAVLALVFAYSLVNTFLVESIFDWPGLGSYAASSVATLDTPAIVGVTLFIAIVYVVCNLVVDLVQAALDPRIRLR
jgi:peptide/nickel transport system permease protein